MQKLTKLLEAHVQWIALGLAALFLGAVVWFYVLHTQVAVQLGTTPVPPGEIDTRIAEGPIRTLKHDMESPQEIAIAVPDLMAPWVATVAGPSKLPGLIPIFGGWDPTIPNNGAIVRSIEGPGQDKNPIDHTVTAPAPIPVAISHLRTTAQYPDPTQPAPAGNAHVDQVMVTENKDYVSVQFKVEVAKLSKSFHELLDKKANIPPVAYLTETLKVDLVREEKLPDGKWGNPTTIKSLSIHPLMDYPGDDAKLDKAIQFKDWATKHADEIIHPEFYQTAPGAPVWHRPDQPVDTTKAPVEPVIAPTPPIPTPTPRPIGPGRQPPRGAPVPKYAPADPSRPNNPYGGGYPPVPGGYPNPGGYPYPGAGGPNQRGGYPYPGAGGPYQRGGYPIPGTVYPPPGMNQGFNNQLGGMFDPTRMANDIEIIAHDDTVMPGKTYRYKLQYRIYNSLYDINVISKPNISSKFAITSAMSEPTGEITIPERTNFFIKSVRDTEVKFDVFTWDGIMKVKEVRALPGDLITQTNWNVVDIRKDAKNNPYVILADAAGNVQRRDFRGDQDNPDYHSLLEQAKAAASASAR